MGGKKATSTSQVTIPPEVLARYNAVNAKAEAAASKPFQSFGTTAADYVAQINPQQMAGISGVNQASGSYQPYLSAASGATQGAMGGLSASDIQKYMSPYLSNVADTTAALMRQSNEQAQSGALGAAAMSGAFGGDRAGIAAANLNQQNQLAMGKAMADIYQQGYGQALGAAQQQQGVQLQGAQQLANLGAQAQGLGLQGAQAQIAAGSMQQQTEQAGKDAMIQRFMQEQGYPFQVAQFLANIAIGTGTASGSTTTSTQPLGIFGNLASGGRVEGYATGGGVSGSNSYVPEVEVPVGQLAVAEPPQQRSSGLGQVVSLATKFLASGGVAGDRHGYETGGHPGMDRPIQPVVVPEGGISSTQRPMPRPLDLLTRQPIVAPQDGISSTQRPMPRPTGLAGADVASDTMAALGRGPTGLSAPVQVNPAPEFGKSTGVAAPAASLFDTKIVPIESGGRQTDEAGRPVTSSAGAVGAAQVMEGTGPEAARLAGLPWDRDRWMYDRDYNLALGRAYFNEQLRQFGDPNLAAAAYNAGPGAVRSAMDRATALGGTYLDYLPAETQAYVAKFSGDATAQPQSGAGLGAAQTPVEAAPGGVKPYEDRNAIGQFLYNPATNKLDRNAVLSILAGLGTMASSRTISPIAALLQGVGGGAAAYQDLQAAEPTRVAQTMMNSRNARAMYQQQVALGETRPFDQWAAAQFGGGAASMIGGPSAPAAPGAQTSPAPSYQGVPLDIFGRGMTQIISLPGGVQVQAGQSYGYLKALENELQSKVSLGIVDPSTLVGVQQKIADIERANGQIVDVNGRSVVDPTYSQMQFAGNQTASDLTRSNAILTSLPEKLTSVSDQDRRIEEMARVAAGLPTSGPAAPFLAPIAGLATQFGLSEANSMTTNYNMMAKLVADEARQSLNEIGGDTNTNTYINNIVSSTVNPTMDKGSMAEILAIKAGINDYQREMYTELNKSATENPTANLAQLEREYRATHPIGPFIEAQRPRFAEALGVSASAVQEGATGIDDATGKPIIFKNGQWEFQ